MKFSFQQAQQNVSEIANRTTYNKDLLFELLAAYGRSASSITKLRNDVNNLANNKDNEILQRNIVYFKYVPNGKLLPTIERLKQDPLVVRYNPRYLIVTDYNKLAAIDTKKRTTLDIKIQDIDRHTDFFYGWTGDETMDEKTEAVADRRAAEKMTELYGEIAKVNKAKLNEKNSKFRHDLNVFFSRLLFCFFAEDTKVFSKDDKGIFTNAIKDFTQIDGSDLDVFLNALFESFDRQDKSKYSSPFSRFPYVNGGLFSTDKDIQIPKFSPQARKTIIECGSLLWSEINPDIFGSMFQGVVDEEYRSEHQMHYTSVPNILKAIEPLFLDELREDFDKYFDVPKKLAILYDRISKIKIFDPACGSGNFLVIAYKELRKLENAIITRLLEGKYLVKVVSRIKLDNFFGIEIDDFACEVAKLSLHIAKHQMDIEFEEQFHEAIPLIPLKETGKIVQGNAATLDWNQVCPNEPYFASKQVYEQSHLIADDYKQEKLLDDKDVKKSWDEIYVISNPPYQGSSVQEAEQKDDMAFVFRDFQNYKNLDYVSCWFKKGVDYIEHSDSKISFVSTNSICQGEQVELIWPYILKKVEIGFAYRSFKWSNNAKGNAGVTCVIISLRNASSYNKYIYENGIKLKAANINPYLIDASNLIIGKRQKPLSKLPVMSYGSKPVDGGNLILTTAEKDDLITHHPKALLFIKKFMGADEFIYDKDRWCLWITDNALKEAMIIKPVADRIAKVKEMRLKSKKKATKEVIARTPFKFGEIRYSESESIIIPSVTSEGRKYIPVGYLDKNIVVSNRAHVVTNAPLYVFGLLTSRMHVVWTKAVTGRLKTDINYSSTVVYNNFPVSPMTEHQQSELSAKAREVLLIRENHSEKTLAEMYDPDKMPEDLGKAHHNLDLTVDRLYRYKPYESDEERLSDLFALYGKMIAHEKGDK